MPPSTRTIMPGCDPAVSIMQAATKSIIVIKA